MTNAAPAPEVETPKIPNDQLDSLVSPIALYPDPLVAQILAASTYPLEIIQLEQWMTNNNTLKDKALADAVAKLPFDSSVQALAAFPDVIKQLGEHVSWTMDLGNAFLAQQSDVMDAIQRMRARAQGTGNLKTTAQQEVETQTVEGGKQVIVIQPADPEVVYVPQYSPTVVYGPPVYPYPYAYPPGYGLLAFGTGVALGAAWGSNWGNCNWGGGDITINNNNNFNRNNNNINRGQGNRAGQGGAGNRWSHNPSHRGGAPYGDRGTADKFGGRARQQPAGGAGNRAGPGGRSGSGGLGGGQGLAGGNRPGGAGNLGGASGLGGGNRSSVAAGAGGLGGGNRPGGGAGVSTRSGGGSSLGSGDRVGNRSVSGSGGFGSSNNAFGGSGFGGSSARSASARGGSSMGGGGVSRGGGGGGARGGGGRGGGGGRR